MKTHSKLLRGATAAALLLAAAGAVGCEDSDPVAPADSVIIVTATPATIVIDASEVEDTSEIEARVYAKNGTPLPGQSILFSTDNGRLDPGDENPTETDDLGVADVTLITNSAATVTARSGNIMGTVRVNTTTCNLRPFVLSVAPQTLDNCSSNSFALSASVLSTSGSPCPNVEVVFSEVNSTRLGNFMGGNVKVSDANGLATAIWTPDLNLCQMNCDPDFADPNDPAPGDCELIFVCAAQNGQFDSNEVQINDAVN